MSSKLVADFRATIHAPTLEEPQQGRVMMRPDKLVCATADCRETVPLGKVFDIGVGVVPPDLQEFFSDSVSLGFADGTVRKTIVLEATATSMERFRTVLFHHLLTGERVEVRYPAKRGGRIIDSTYESGKLEVTRQSLSISRPTGTLRITLDDVTTFSTGRTTVDGTDQQFISVGFLDGTMTVTTRILTNSDRVHTLLGRYLKLDYRRIHSEIVRIDLSPSAIRALLAIDAGMMDLEGMLPESADATETISRLREENLLKPADGELLLTRRGRIATQVHGESVNN